ncbi:MAG: SMC family ATPase [Armatimonadetes bacterium]|nr:SMC family ATPase [Armatimonadota bacterium]
MIIRSVKLRNIKSFGPGKEGRGTVINLEAGINRIAGLNGSGKSTIIEAIGYAVFDGSPDRNEESYLIRTGEKEGEIRVSVEADGESYHVERGVGSASRKRWKVIRESDGFLEAEGDKEVPAFLCRLLGAKSESRLSETYSKLVGVQQGRITLPFELRGKQAKDYFDPLLDVEIFRKCFDGLKPALDRLKDLREREHLEAEKCKVLVENMEDSPQKMGEASRAVEEARSSVEQLEGKAKNQAQVVAKHEELRKTLSEAGTEAAKVEGREKQCLEKHSASAARFQESESAAKILLQTAQHFKDYRKAESELRELEKKRTERDNLQKKIHALQREESDLLGKSEGSRKQAVILKGQAGEKKSEHKERFEKLTRIAALHRETLESSRLTIEKASRFQELLSVTQQWRANLTEKSKSAERLYGQIEAETESLKNMDRGRLEKAQQAVEEATGKREEKLRELEGARQKHKALDDQLRELGSGICPFLKEKCRQFDPQKVALDLADLKNRTDLLGSELAQRDRVLSECRAELVKAQRDDKEYESRLAALRRMTFDFLDRIFEADQEASRSQCEELNREASVVDIALPLLAPVDGERIIQGEDDLPELTLLKTCRNELSSLLSAVSRVASDAESRVKDAVKEADRIKDSLAREGQRLDEERKFLARLEKEAASLLGTALKTDLEAGEFASLAEKKTESAAALGKSLDSLGDVDSQIEQWTSLKNENKKGYEAYLAARPLAEKLEERTIARDTAAGELEKASKDLQGARARLEEASRNFNEKDLQEARARMDELNSRLGGERERLKSAEGELETQKDRVRQWTEAKKKHGARVNERIRLESATEIIAKAREILKKTAPSVAEHLCFRIASQAQTIFNALNHEPAQLTWDSDPYSLRIATGGGERRFAMLSGGEQTKVALSMTLAMVKMWSNCGLCIFDEPTYGVDRESRISLADAIVQAQEECRFDQLLLVSHDSAFDDKIEHTVMLARTPLTGSSVM